MEMAFLSELKALKEGGCTLYLNVLHIALPLPQMETRGCVIIMIGEQRPFQYLSVQNGLLKALQRGDRWEGADLGVVLPASCG